VECILSKDQLENVQPCHNLKFCTFNAVDVILGALLNHHHQSLFCFFPSSTPRTLVPQQNPLQGHRLHLLSDPRVTVEGCRCRWLDPREPLERKGHGTRPMREHQHHREAERQQLLKVIRKQAFPVWNNPRMLVPTPPHISPRFTAPLPSCFFCGVIRP